MSATGRALAISMGDALPPAAWTRRTLVLSRWTSDAPAVSEHLAAEADEYVVSLCLRATRLELRAGAALCFGGVMRAGGVHICGPGSRLVAQISAPIDMLHLHVPSATVHERLKALGAAEDALLALGGRTLGDGLLEQLGKLLVSEGAQRDAAYGDAIAQTLLSRVLQLSQTHTCANALPKWRLLRVQALIEERLSEPLSLGDLAASAGLSRMHFASQFRASTGSSPHQYLLCRRVEAAKALLSAGQMPLAEIALQVGFLAQAHFTTVFKRFTGSTPARWRRENREAEAPASSRRASVRSDMAGWAARL